MITSFVTFLMLLLQAPPAQTASIQGRVVAADGQSALSRVTVELRRAGTNDAPIVSSTNEDGRFVFASLLPGQYRLTATRSGYVPAEYGQRKPGAVGLPLVLAAGQQLREAQIALTASASVSGRIFFRTGKPVVNAEVMAMKVSFQDGRRVLTLEQTGRTNDLGEYRLYWLTPGKYYISTMPWDGRPISGGVVMNANGAAAAVDMARMTVLAGDVARAPLGFQPGAPPSDTEAWVPVYFPGTANEDAAAPIDLAAGANVRSIDIITTPVGPLRIRGTIMDATGQPAQNAQIFRSRNSPPSNAFVTEMADPAKGTFDIRGVVPGPYTLLAIAGDSAGKVVVNVGETDLEDVRIPVAAGVTFSGKLSVDGSNNPVPAGLRVSLRPDPLVPGMPIPASAVSAEGQFTFSQVLPGDYLVTVQPLQPAPPVATGQRANAFPALPQRGSPALPPLPPALQNAYVKSVRLGSADVLNGGLRIDSPPGDSLEIVIGANPGRVEGDVGRLPNATVVLVPAARMRRPDLYKSVLTNPEGRFELQGVTPGDYILLTWADVETGAWMNADFLKPYESRGRTLRVEEGSRHTMQQLTPLD
ncbi:MAG TPA: carboxypeptidase-like regulatory domain-containing protein [Terriglobia bacterium]|nr:carboxypeptidase-like regulatory domain-containing protein [Terriglobia bacterium]